MISNMARCTIISTVAVVMEEAVLGATMVGGVAEVEPVEETIISKTTHTIRIIIIISNTAGIKITEIIVT